MQGSLSQGHDKHRDKWCNYGNSIFSVSFSPEQKHRHLTGCSARLLPAGSQSSGKLGKN